MMDTGRKGAPSVLDRAFSEVYTKFKLHFYRQVFGRFQNREANLTTVETFCMEIIQALERPTVNEFASFLQISPPNAAYKVNSLVQKGYLEKVRSDTDRREYYLVPTRKYQDYYNISYSYLSTVMDRIGRRFQPREVAYIEQVLNVISHELMPEIELPDRRDAPRGERSRERATQEQPLQAEKNAGPAEGEAPAPAGARADE